MINWTVSDEEESKHTATQVYSWEANESLNQLIYDVQPSASLNSYAFSPNGRFLVFGMGPGSGATTQFGLQAFTEAVPALQVLGRLHPKETFDGEHCTTVFLALRRVIATAFQSCQHPTICEFSVTFWPAVPT